jgi:hypothetical protein
MDRKPGCIVGPEQPAHLATPRRRFPSTATLRSSTAAACLILAVSCVPGSVYSAADIIVPEGSTLIDVMSISRESTVLVLGKDNEEGSQETLHSIAAQVEELGFKPVMLRHKAEVPGMSLHDKLITYAALSKFVVVVDVDVSGHVYEMAVLDMMRAPTILLRRPRAGSSWMVADMGDVRNSTKSFLCHKRDCSDVLGEAVAWVDDYIMAKAVRLNRLYPDDWARYRPKAK